MKDDPAHDPYGALRVSNFRDYLVGSFLSSIARQALMVAVSWEIYQWTHSATALGLMGLVTVLPLLVLSLPAGAIADHHDRKKLIQLGSKISVVLCVLLAALSYWHRAVPNLAPLRWANALLRQIALVFERQVDPATLRFDEPALPLLFLLLLVLASVRILVWPARSSIAPLLLPNDKLSNAITWNASAFEIATVAGPALGGFLIAAGDFASVYALSGALELVFVLLLARVRYLQAPAITGVRRTWRDVLAGADFIWRRKVILGASSLDLFAVLLGGATALLPVYADKILHVGPIGLGWLRAAPSIGAFAMAMWLAHRAPLRRPGLALLWSVVGFGAAIMVFGYSRWYWLSLVALVFTGAFDNVSVVVRQSLVQLLTPDALRGRVTAVNQIFIGSSNEIGALRAGLMGALIGPVAAVIWGGIGTIAVAVAVARAVPGLRNLPALHTLKPDE
ncbi:MAG TPA: MFS transporter [Opitutaceae bacterium]|nr:MFS transporter [Opitutaceae bacterium]